MRRTGQAGPATVCVVLWLGALPGCDMLRELRDALQGTAEPDPVGRAGLRVEVEPPDGISILLDGVRVASMSPYVSQQLKQGSHLLEVRAMGYHPFRLPVRLTDDEMVTVPVALRARPPGSKPTPEEEAIPGEPAPPPPEFAPQASPDIPDGVNPIALHVVVKPAAPLRLNGLDADGKHLVLKRIHGSLGFGPLELTYEIGGRGLLVYTVPSDGGTWRFDGRELKPGARFRHNKGVVRIEHTASDGVARTILLKR